MGQTGKIKKEQYEDYMYTKTDRSVNNMEWNMKTNPTFKDISANRSPYFLTVRRHSAFVAKDYYNSRLDKWFKTSCCTEEVSVAAWMPLPEFDYDKINKESELIKSADGKSHLIESYMTEKTDSFKIIEQEPILEIEKRYD